MLVADFNIVITTPLTAVLIRVVTIWYPHDTIRIATREIRYVYCEVPNSCAVRNNSVGWKIHPN